MKNLFFVLFCIIVCNSCGGKTKVDRKEEAPKEVPKEAAQREFPEECKALEFVNASMEIYIACSALFLIRVYQEKLPASEGNKACENSFSKNMEPVEDLENQGKISSEFMTNVEEKIRELGKVNAGICSPPAADSSPEAVVNWLRGLSDCMQRAWNPVYQGLKVQYSCN